jgi:hypothetical protein
MAAAQSSKAVTIVYDVHAREFTCWYEGDRFNAPCGSSSHHYYQGLYFFRGQTVYLQFDGARVADLFSSNVTVNDLAEPAVPIFGSLSSLPVVNTIGPASSVVLGPNVKLVGGPNSTLANLPAVLDLLPLDDFKSLIQTSLLGLVGTDEALKALTFANSGAIAKLDVVAGPVSPIVTQTADLLSKATTLMGNADPALGWLRVQYCPAPLTPPAAGTTTNFSKFNQRLLELAQLIAQQNALVQEVVAVEIKSRATDLITQVTAFQDPKLGGFVSSNAGSVADSSGLLYFQDVFRRSGYVQQPSTIQNIGIDAARSEYKPANSLIQAVNAAHKAIGTKPDHSSRDRLKANLGWLASQWGSIDAAITRYATIAAYADSLRNYLNRADNVFTVQTSQNNLSRSLIDAGAAANCVAQGMPLPESFDRPSLGTWYGGETIALELKQGTRLPAYDLTGIQTTSQVSVTRDPATARAVVTGPQDATTSVAKTTFLIHNTYQLQLAAGFMWSWFHDVKFQVAQQTTTTGGVSTATNSFVQTQDRSYRFLPTVDLVFYPFARDFFPWKARYPGEKRPSFLKEIGLLAGSSISDPTKDFFFGGVWVPRSGIGIQGGIHYGYVDHLPDGVTLNTPITASVTPVTQKLDHGWFVGVIMHMQVFQSVFAVIFKK